MPNWTYTYILDIHEYIQEVPVMVTAAGIGHSDTCSNPGLNAFHIALKPVGKV